MAYKHEKLLLGNKNKPASKTKILKATNPQNTLMAHTC